MKEIKSLSAWYRIQSVFAVRHPNHIWCDNRHYIDKYSGISSSVLHRYHIVFASDKYPDDYFDMPKRVVKISPRGYGKMKHKELNE